MMDSVGLSYKGCRDSMIPHVRLAPRELVGEVTRLSRIVAFIDFGVTMLENDENWDIADAAVSTGDDRIFVTDDDLDRLETAIGVVIDEIRNPIAVVMSSDDIDDVVRLCRIAAAIDLVVTVGGPAEWDLIKGEVA